MENFNYIYEIIYLEKNIVKLKGEKNDSGIWVYKSFHN